ncbi:hypothetical protein [Methylobacterium sp. WL9]|uniref:hypothetical protein n=1 Tax=Methylobacterium sp. WL9 TaxID=2603898 RepID=UPI0011C8198C|nr:hypothetical protein [Methylobacterium sp. WL9]TXN24007.1 hypothetical protein FV217_04895 [Methylobacterium sp. WL9]
MTQTLPTASDGALRADFPGDRFEGPLTLREAALEVVNWFDKDGSVGTLPGHIMDLRAALALPPAQDPVPALGLPAGEAEGLRALSDRLLVAQNYWKDSGNGYARFNSASLEFADAAQVYFRTHVLAPPASAADGEGLRSALRAILKLDPATTEFTLAGQMAEIAAKALSSEGR